MVGKKKIDKKIESELIGWISKAKEKGYNIKQIRKALNKKYRWKDVGFFLKNNFQKEDEADNSIEDDEMEADLKEEDKAKKELEELKLEAKGTEVIEEAPEEETSEEETSEEETPKEKPVNKENKPKKESEEIPIQKMSTYDIELLNQIASINQGIMKLVKILEKKR